MTGQDPGQDSFSPYWCNLEWSGWVAFATTSRTLDSIPDTRGLFRIRPVGQEMMMYIGWTGGSLRQAFAGIRQNAARAAMPWNDPWPAAPALWAWKDAKGYAYECSAAPYGETSEDLMAGEAYLLYAYRLERRESPLCNFGRFHRNYRSPSDEKDGRAGGKIGPGQPRNPGGGPSASPLEVKEEPGAPGWMGLSWSPKRSLRTHTTTVVPKGPGYYIIFDAGTGAILATGFSDDCAQELFAISRKPWDGRDLDYAFCSEPPSVPDHNLRERANDLLGNYIEHFGTVPEFQFRERT